uniref:C-type lectin domain-containing protein n=1 Tax=Anabas testudineus TaxID=64144 RepID=A0A3Q1IG07_ANATE
MNPLLLTEKLCETKPVTTCEEDWELHGDKCYYFSTNKSTWNQSRDDCRRGGGDLMNKDDDTFWIGLTDSKEEDKWLWVDDSPLNTRFDCCGKMFSDDLKCWTDVACIILFSKSICEKSAETERVTRV